MLVFYLSHSTLNINQDDQVWSTVIAAFLQSWAGRLSFERTESGLLGTTRYPLVPLAIFEEALHMATEGFGPEVKVKHAVTMVVDTGKAEALVERVETQYKSVLKPWELYASPSAYEEMRVDLDRSVKLTFDEISDSRYGLLRLNNEEHFLFSRALIRGEESPCFYCSSRKHTPAKCPSKGLFASREALQALGRSSLSRANSCFLKYLTCPEAKLETIPGNLHTTLQDDPIWLAHMAFYDIRQVVQLRFFRLFFGTDHLDWERIRNGKSMHSQGGATWLALDCLRVGDQDKARHYIEIGMERDPADWKPLCLLGFLNIESDGLSKAEYYFEKALGLSRRIPQRILLNLLLARVNHLNHETKKARERARSAVLLDRWCQEALYELIVLDFNLAKNGQPLQGLERLARQNGYYWMSAFIDPDLTPQSGDVHPCLSRIAEEARHEASIAWQDAQRQYRGVKALLGTDSKVLHEAQDLASRLEGKSKNEGYIDSTERLHGARILKALCQKAIDEQRQELKNIIAALKARVDGIDREVMGIDGEALPEPLKELNALRTKIDDARRNVVTDFVNTHQDFMAKRQTYSDELDEIERIIRAWKNKRRVANFLVSFLIRASGFLFATFAFAISFPFLMAAVQNLIPQARIGMDDYGTLQRIFIVVGVLASFSMAAISSYSKAYGSRGQEKGSTKHAEQPKPTKTRAKVGKI